MSPTHRLLKTESSFGVLLILSYRITVKLRLLKLVMSRRAGGMFMLGHVSSWFMLINEQSDHEADCEPLNNQVSIRPVHSGGSGTLGLGSGCYEEEDLQRRAKLVRQTSVNGVRASS